MKKKNLKEFLYLAFEGGGGKGVVNEGVLKALGKNKLLPEKTPLGLLQEWIVNQNNYFTDYLDFSPPEEILKAFGKPQNKIIGVSGASAGAITAFAMCLGDYSQADYIDSVADKVKELLDTRITVEMTESVRDSMYINQIVRPDQYESMPEKDKAKTISVFESFFDYPLHIMESQLVPEFLGSESDFWNTYRQRFVRLDDKDSFKYESSSIKHDKTHKGKTVKGVQLKESLNPYLKYIVNYWQKKRIEDMSESEINEARQDPMIRSLLYYFNFKEFMDLDDIVKQEIIKNPAILMELGNQKSNYLTRKLKEIRKRNSQTEAVIRENTKITERFLFSLIRLRGIFSGRGPVLFFRYIIQFYIIEVHQEAIQLVLRNLDFLEANGITKKEYWPEPIGLKSYDFAKNFSFHHLKVLSGIDLRVTLTNITDGRSEIFGAYSEEYQHIPVAEAISGSMSLPFAFTPLIIERRSNSGEAQWEEFVDGGMINNLPTHAFDTQNVDAKKHYSNLDRSSDNEFGFDNLNTQELPLTGKGIQEIRSLKTINKDLKTPIVVNNSALDTLGFRLESGDDTENNLRLLTHYHPRETLELLKLEKIVSRHSKDKILDAEPIRAIKFIVDLLNVFLTVAEQSQIRTSEEARQVIEIYCGTIAVTEFNPPAEKRQTWVDLAYKKVNFYLNNPHSRVLESKLILDKYDS